MGRSKPEVNPATRPAALALGHPADGKRVDHAIQEATWLPGSAGIADNDWHDAIEMDGAQIAVAEYCPD